MRTLYFPAEDADGEMGLSATRQEWAQVLLDLEEMQRQIYYYRSKPAVEDDGTYGLEPATESLIDRIREII